MNNYRPEAPSMSPRNMHGLGALMDMDKSTMPMAMHSNLEDMPLAMAYVPWQHWKNVYDLNKALKVGTIFPELDMPFMGMRGERL